MPESFAINENDPNLTTIYNNYYTNFRYEDIHFTDNGVGTYIVQVKGKIPINEIQELETAGEIWTTNTGVIAGRYDVARFNENQAEASAELSLKAVNPINKISFKKLDEKGEALAGATFGLFKKTSSGWPQSPTETRTTLADGAFEFSKLEPGEYKVEETNAPKGYIKLEEPVIEFTVEKSGKIVKKVTVDGNVTTEEVNTTNPIEVVNNKGIEFEKVDGENKETFLPGAEFKVFYKKNLKDDYTEYKVKNKNGTEETLKLTSGQNGKFRLDVSKSVYYALEEIKAPKGYTKIPCKIKEFALLDGKTYVLQETTPNITEVGETAEGTKINNDGTKANLLKSEIIEVNPTDKTFKQRIIINPNQTSWRFDGLDTHLRFTEDTWSITPTKKARINFNDIEVGVIKYAVLENGQTIDSATLNFKELIANRRQTLDGKLRSRYNVRELFEIPYTTYAVTTNKSVVVEYTGKLNEDQISPINIDVDIKSDQYTHDTMNFNVAFGDNATAEKEYVEITTKEGETPKPIEVENRKAEYPWTGGMGTLIFTVSGLILMSAAAYVYSRKRRASYDE